MDSAEKKIKNKGLYLHATFTSHKTLGVIISQTQESNAILRQKNNLKLQYENSLQKTKSVQSI